MLRGVELMDVMSLFSILTVSVPEFVLDIMLGLLIIGEKKRILPNKSNFIRILIAVALMCVVSYVVRANIPVGVQTFSIQIAAYVIILKYVYEISFKQSVASTTFFIGVLIIINTLYTAPLLGYMHKSLEDVFRDDLFRLVASLPERLFQIFILVSIWQLKGVFIDIKKYKPILKLSTIIFSLLFAVEYIIFFTYVQIFSSVTAYIRVVFFIGCVCLIILNLLFYKFITKYTKTVIEDEQETVRKKISEVNKIIRTIKNAGSENNEN